MQNDLDVLFMTLFPFSWLKRPRGDFMNYF